MYDGIYILEYFELSNYLDILILESLDYFLFYTHLLIQWVLEN